MHACVVVHILLFVAPAAVLTITGPKSTLRTTTTRGAVVASVIQDRTESACNVFAGKGDYFEGNFMFPYPTYINNYQKHKNELTENK